MLPLFSSLRLRRMDHHTRSGGAAAAAAAAVTEKQEKLSARSHLHIIAFTSTRGKEWRLLVPPLRSLWTVRRGKR